VRGSDKGTDEFGDVNLNRFTDFPDIGIRKNATSCSNFTALTKG